MSKPRLTGLGLHIHVNTRDEMDMGLKLFDAYHTEEPVQCIIAGVPMTVLIIAYKHHNDGTSDFSAAEVWL